MQDKTAKRTIKTAVNKRLPNEPQLVKAYIEDLILITYKANRNDYYTFKSDTEALKDAIEINLDYEREEVLKEAREQVAQGWTINK